MVIGSSSDVPHRRYNPLRGSWLLISPNRGKRPWHGSSNQSPKIESLSYDSTCDLCPGNERAGGKVINQKYNSTYLFVNDFSAFKEKPVNLTINNDSDLLRMEMVTGKCYVLVLSPVHNFTVASLSISQNMNIIKMWTLIYAVHINPASMPFQLTPISSGNIFEQASIFDNKPDCQYRYMQIFENKGTAAGCSNTHPHVQVWITSSLPEEADIELRNMQLYRVNNNDQHMLKNYAKQECAIKSRIVYQNEVFVALCPWWGTWPYETMIIPKEHKRALTDLKEYEQEELANTIISITKAYDRLFGYPFPYNMGIHQAPLKGTNSEIESSYFHIHYYPPLAKDSRKFLAGYELMAEPTRDFTPEEAAATLRECYRIISANE